MSRVKMNAKHEYEYLANYKILQNVFKKEKIDKVRMYMKCTYDACAIDRPISLFQLIDW